MEETKRRRGAKRRKVRTSERRSARENEKDAWVDGQAGVKGRQGKVC